MCLTVIKCTRQFPVVRPDCFRCSACSLSFACVEEIYDIHIAVTVAVILAKVTTCGICCLYSVNHKVGYVHIVLLTAVYRSLLTVIHKVIGQSYRAEHVKCRHILVIGLRLEVIYRRACSTTIAIALLVKHVIKSGGIVSRLETHIGKLHQYHQSFRRKISFANSSARPRFVHIRSFTQRPELSICRVLFIINDECAVGLLDGNLAVFGLPIVIELITDLTDSDGCAIWLRAGLPTAISGHSPGSTCGDHQRTKHR